MSKQINKLTGEAVKSTTVKGGWTTIEYVNGETEKMRNGAVAGVIVAMADVNDADAAPAPKGKKEPKEPNVPKAATPKKEEGDVSYIRRVKSATYDVRDYDRVKSAGGNSSLDSGDVIAVNLRGKSLDDTYKIAAHITETTPHHLKKRYGHLNFGMQRMAVGNLIRGHIKHNGMVDESVWQV